VRSLDLEQTASGGNMARDVIKEGYTRVTEILRPYSGFDNAPEFVKEKAAHKAMIGSLVHDAIHMHYECIPFYPLEEECGGYYDSFQQWESHTGAWARGMENRYYDDVLKITGQIDALMKFPDEDSLIMVDWKTSSSWNKKMETSWSLQGTFYHHLLIENNLSNISERFLFIQLDPNGKMPQIREFTYTAEEMGNCMAALQIYRRFNPLK